MFFQVIYSFMYMMSTLPVFTIRTTKAAASILNAIVDNYLLVVVTFCPHLIFLLLFFTLKRVNTLTSQIYNLTVQRNSFHRGTSYVNKLLREVSKYGVFSGPYFPAFRLNKERYSQWIKSTIISWFVHIY